MRKIKNENLAQLLMQLRFTPETKRRSQFESSEKLLGMIRKDRQYPFEFVCFRITGFRPKAAVGEDLISGEELIEDLQIFTAKLSGQVALSVSSYKEQVYGIEELAAKLEVSTKTINRWRKRGLRARKVVFADGRKRFGILESSVEEFVKANPAMAARAKSFVRLTSREKESVIRRARALGGKGELSQYQIIKQISSSIGRSPETVRYTIHNYDKSNPETRVFDGPGGVLKPATAGELYRLYRQGCSVKELMKRFKRSRSSVYRIVNRRRAKSLLAMKIDFIASDEFLEDDAKRKILGKEVNVPDHVLPGVAEPPNLAGESLLPEYLQRLKGTPVLSRERELELFRRYNYLKYLACVTRAGMKATQAKGGRLTRIEKYLAEVERIKTMIIESNLRLVVGIANKHVGSGTSLVDLVSEGNFSLMRAVEKFDYTRGFRFATYASWAIAKDYARKIPAEAARRDKAAAASLERVQQDQRTTAAADFAAIESAQRSLAQVIKDELDEREQYIILHHFGFVGSAVRKKKKTLKQIGEDLNLTKERVRQLELGALQKLRQSLSIEEFELLTG